MARRKRVRFPVALCVAVALILGGLSLVPLLIDKNRTKPRLDVVGYLDNPTAVSGNRFLLEGSVAERLVHNEAGAVFSVTGNGGNPLPVVVPESVNPGFNVEKGQKLLFDVRISDDGSIVATHIAKQ